MNQAPLIVFDHVNGEVHVVGGQPETDPAVAETLKSQEGVVTTSSGAPSRG